MNNCVIIDDHALFNDGLALILKESTSFHVLEQVYDSRFAYQKCASLQPDLVLVDYNMPHLNGAEVVEQLLSLAKKPKIVVISMYLERKDIRFFEKLGANGFLPKTIQSEDLIRRLEQIMKGEDYFERKKTIIEEVSNDWFSLKQKLTKRELEILLHVKKGLNTSEISSALSLSFYTVETHRKNINQKLKFDSKVDFFTFLEKLD